MRSLIKGFTLAEVLITLAIIGTIASVTLPSLQLNVQKQQVGPALAKGVNTLENAARTLLQQESARNLKQACGGDNVDFPTCLENKGVIRNVSGFRKDYSQLKSNTTNKSLQCITGKDNISYCVDVNSYSVITTGGATTKRYYGSYYSVYVDTNGEKAPNVIGKDVFLVYVDLYGEVIPYGSNVAQKYKTTGARRDWQKNCNNTTITNALTCAGAIADNGWQVKYKY